MPSTRNSRDRNRGNWQRHEDDRLTRAVYKVDPNPIRQGVSICWTEVAAMVPSRDAKQCRERWEQTLRPDLNHNPITAAEGDFINAYVFENGTRWAAMAKRPELKGHPDNQIKNWWNSSGNRKTREYIQSKNKHIQPKSPQNRSSDTSRSNSRPTTSGSQSEFRRGSQQLPLPLFNANDLARHLAPLNTLQPSHRINPANLSPISPVMSPPQSHSLPSYATPSPRESLHREQYFPNQSYRDSNSSSSSLSMSSSTSNYFTQDPSNTTLPSFVNLAIDPALSQPLKLPPIRDLLSGIAPMDRKIPLPVLEPSIGAR